MNSYKDLEHVDNELTIVNPYHKYNEFLKRELNAIDIYKLYTISNGLLNGCSKITISDETLQSTIIDTDKENSREYLHLMKIIKEAHDKHQKYKNN